MKETEAIKRMSRILHANNERHEIYFGYPLRPDGTVPTFHIFDCQGDAGRWAKDQVNYYAPIFKDNATPVIGCIEKG